MHLTDQLRNLARRYRIVADVSRDDIGGQLDEGSRGGIVGHHGRFSIAVAMSRIFDPVTARTPPGGILGQAGPERGLNGPLLENYITFARITCKAKSFRARISEFHSEILCGVGAVPAER